MGPEEFLTEEEVLKRLKVNKAQLENYVREGKLSPLYQESVRKFKLSDISKITVGISVPPIEITPPFEDESPLIKTSKEEGSTRVIEPPRNSLKIGINKTGVKAKVEKETEEFLKPLEEIAPTTQGKYISILLIVALVFSVISMFVFTYNLQGKELPQINKLLVTFGSILPVGKGESNKIESEINSLIQASQQTKKDAEALIKETEEFLKQ